MRGDLHGPMCQPPGFDLVNADGESLGSARVLTIDIDIPTRTIFEVRGRCNRMPSAGERAIVERWAAVEGLKLGDAFQI